MARAVLVGLPGTGKTTVAALLAERWGCDALDSDEVLSASMGCSVPEYLRQHGETEFRRAELEVLEELLARDAVVATGGGAVVTPMARALLRAQPTVWLDCDDETLLARVAGADRPLLELDPANSLDRLRRERTPWYREVSSARVDACGEPEEVVRRVLEVVGP